MDDVTDLYLTVQERIEHAITLLPVLTKEAIPSDDSCPICLNPFDSILEGKATETLSNEGILADADHLAGVTKLVGCGHIFCKACLVEWIRGQHGSCPSCRDVFSSIRPPSDSDYESSDGEYVPGDDEEDEEDDGFLDSDGFMETDSVFDEMDIGADYEDDMVMDGEQANIGLWEEDAAGASMENWGLSDGDGSESVSEGEGLAVSVELLAEDGADVYSDGGEGSDALEVPEEDSVEPK